MFYTFSKLKTFQMGMTVSENKVEIKIISVNQNGDVKISEMENSIDGVEFVYSNGIKTEKDLHEILNNADIAFLIGVTHETDIRAIAQLALEYDVLMIAMITDSFSFEIDKNINVTQLLYASDALLESIKGITDAVIRVGMISVDINDIRQILLKQRYAIISTHSATGENRAIEAVKNAISSALFDNVDLKMVNGVLVNITAESIGLSEFNDVCDVILKQISEKATVKIGMSIENTSGDMVTISIVIADFNS